MSYILDALNKSERERRSNRTPDLETIHRQLPQKATLKNRWPGILALFVSINVGALWYWSATSNNQATPNQSTGIEKNLEIVPMENASLGKSSPLNETSADTSVAVTRQEGLLIKPDDVTSTLPESSPVRLSELPINIQRQIPDLRFSSHLYSEDASYRMVNINGRMMQEGDNVADGFRLVEITEAGVVLSFRHYIFEVGVLRDWSFN